MKVEFTNLMEFEAATILVDLLQGPLLFYGVARRAGKRWLVDRGYVKKQDGYLYLLPEGETLAKSFALLIRGAEAVTCGRQSYTPISEVSSRPSSSRTS